MKLDWEGRMEKAHKIIISTLLMLILSLLIPVPFTEYYTETETYEREYKYKVHVERWTGSTFLCRYYIVNGTIQNLENRSGEFELYVYVGRFVEGKFEIYDSKSLDIYLEPNQTEEFEVYLYTSLDVPICNPSYDIDPPTVLDTRQVNKSRTIYKTVIQLVLESLGQL